MPVRMRLSSLISTYLTILRNTTATTVMYTSHMTPLLVSIVFLSLTSERFHYPFFAVRKAHNNGRNHLANVRDYYACESPQSIRSRDQANLILFSVSPSPWSRQSSEYY